MNEDGPTDQRIIDAAGTVLIEKGINDFTTQAVADVADVSQSLVHYYFESKEDLLLATFEDGLDNLAEAIETNVSAENPKERLIELAQYVIRGVGIEESIRFNRMILSLDSRAPYDEDLREVVAYDQSFHQRYVVDAVEDGIETGQFRDVDPETFAAMYVAAIFKATDWKAIFGEDADHDLVLGGLETLVEDYLVKENG